MSGQKIVACPHCGADVAWGPQSPFRPFCSERCKKIDLGAWANDEYRVPATAPTDEFDQPDLTPKSPG